MDSYEGGQLIVFLSRLHLNPTNWAVRRDLTDCQQMHRTIMSAFPEFVGVPARKEAAVLYNLETSTDREPLLLVQSGLQPEWSHLLALDYARRAEAKRVDRFYREGLLVGRRLRFRLRANPTRKISREPGLDGTRTNGARVGLRSEAEWIAWLERKGAEFGFRPFSVEAASALADLGSSKDGKIVGRKLENGSRALTFFSVQFNGRLVIEDTTRFLGGIRTGIGPGKAYGFGLLLVAPEE
jgi:CRISPR system Cascade subunit CasE